MATDASYDPTEFQEALRRAMERRGHSQQAAGDMIGVSQSVVSRWLRAPGDPMLTPPSVESLEKASAYIGLPLSELRRMTGNMPPAELELYNRVAGKRDNRFEALANQMRQAWPDMDEQGKRQVEEINRVLLDLHHGGRARRHHNRKAQPPEDSPRAALVNAA